MLHPDLGSSVQEQLGLVGLNPEEGYEDGQRDGTTLL